MLVELDRSILMTKVYGFLVEFSNSRFELRIPGEFHFDRRTNYHISAVILTSRFDFVFENWK
jgi:hypothetical protein